jgi:hypothetical protein
MFARSYFGARYFAPRYFPQSQGEAPSLPAPVGGRFVVMGVYVPGLASAGVYVPGLAAFDLGED